MGYQVAGSSSQSGGWGGEVESGKWELFFLLLIISFIVTIIEDTAFFPPIHHEFEWALCI